MSRKLTNRELKYISPAVIYGWEIQQTIGFVNGYWNGDHLSPVRTGKMSDKLTNDGYFERVNFMTMFTLRASDKARALTCRRCYRGGVYDGDTRIRDCEYCDGLGVMNNEKS
ncbi:hypothetical protein [Morganella phage Mecenats66]|nr:hypothetical protein [Morganella phage Mecenats66]